MANVILKDRKNEFGHYRRVSNWLEVKFRNVTSRHTLSDYADREGQLAYFTYKRRNYAMGQFMRLLNSVTLEDGSIISGYDCTNWYNPYLIEINSTGEAVRLWEEVTQEVNV